MSPTGQDSDPRSAFTGLLSKAGLDERPSGSEVLLPALAAYVRQVAAAVGVPADAVAHEVTDTATAYLALSDRSGAHPGRDLMLVWDERLGWYVAVETKPGEVPLVVAALAGDMVPASADVAAFVADVLAGRHAHRVHAVQLSTDRVQLAGRMAATEAELS